MSSPERYPWEFFRAKYYEVLVKGLAEFGEKLSPGIGIPPEGKGDFSYPCFEHAKNQHKTPEKFASELLARLGSAPEYFEKIEASGGYINFHIRSERLVQLTLESILGYGENYGRGEQKDISIIVEHTSANPTGPIHVGRARNPIIGDTLVRLLRFAGFEKTIAEYFVNDVGKQMILLLWGLEKFGPEKIDVSSKIDHQIVKYYQKAFEMLERDENVKTEIEKRILALERGEPEITKKVNEIAQKMMAGITDSLSKLDIQFDNIVYESQFLGEKVGSVIEKLKKISNHSNENGAYYLLLNNEKFFFTRSDGTSLYTTRDIAYHIDKFSRSQMVINVLGEDQKLAMEQLKSALSLLGYEDVNKSNRFDIVYYAFVSLPDGRMSTRKGTVVYLDELIAEAIERAYEEVSRRRGNELPEEKMRSIARIVGLGAIRYNIARIFEEKAMVFRWEEALNFEGNSAPFIQYSHARACSILRKAEAQHIKLDIIRRYDPAIHAPELLVKKEELELVKWLSRFPSQVAAACGLRPDYSDDYHPGRAAIPSNPKKPSLICRYAYQTAVLFNKFYDNCPVLAAESERLRAMRLTLVEGSRIVLKNTLWTLGITAPEEM